MIAPRFASREEAQLWLSTLCGEVADLRSRLRSAEETGGDVTTIFHQILSKSGAVLGAARALYRVGWLSDSQYQRALEISRAKERPILSASAPLWRG